MCGSSSLRSDPFPKEKNLVSERVDLKVLVGETCVQLANHFMRSDDGVPSRDLKLTAQEADLLRHDPLDVARVIDRVQRDLREEFFDELVRLHGSSVARPFRPQADK